MAPKFTDADRVGWAREKSEEAGEERELALERGAARAEEIADRVMDRGGRIMAEMEQTDMGKLDEELQIRQAEQILREREAREKEQKRECRKPQGSRGDALVNRSEIPAWRCSGQDVQRWWRLAS